MNDATKALEWLRVTAEDGFPCYPLYETDPNFNNLRTDPRFLALLSKLKQDWERYKTTLVFSAPSEFAGLAQAPEGAGGGVSSS